MKQACSFVLRCALALVFASSAACAQSDADFLAAKAAYERGDAHRLDALLPKLAGHVLEPYVLAWRLRIGLEGADPALVRAYLATYGGTPPAGDLRVEWLKSLGARGQWDAFGHDLAGAPVEDVELACYAIEYRRLREGEAARVPAKRFWFTGRSTPDACEPHFDALIASGAITTADRRARLRLATETGNARLAQSLAATLPPPLRIAEREFARIDRDPAGALARGQFAWKQPAGQDLALYALERAARRDLVAARAAWVKWRARLPEADRQYGNARLAFHAARQLDPDANLYFAEAGSTPLTDEQHAWRVRAALRAQSWADVRAAVDAMPAALREESAWRYWRARALDALGEGEAAKRLFADLASEFNFYGLLAAEAIGKEVDPRSEPVTPADAVLAGFGARLDVQRAVKLGQLDMRLESAREWWPIVRGLNDEGLLVAAEYARRQGLFDRAINTADRTASRHDFALRYQTPFRDEFEAAAHEHDIDSALLFAIARQESRFAPQIVSSAGALGLMQLMPATARWVARQLGESGYRPAQVTDVEVNTRFGAFYFRYWFDRLDSHPALAAAAYNAGPGRAQAWRPAVPIEGAAWVESIPFNETRDYVKKVLANTIFYARALGKPAVSLTTRLGTVTPRGSATGTVVTAN
jgi:soluble lytic murein transglycosylase